MGTLKLLLAMIQERGPSVKMNQAAGIEDMLRAQEPWMFERHVWQGVVVNDKDEDA